ncbi:MAG: hypothetical protein ACRC0F_04390 [Cetobacterium sp.]
MNKKCSDCIFITYRGYCTCHDMESLVGKVCIDYREQSEYDGPSLDNTDEPKQRKGVVWNLFYPCLLEQS